MGRARRDARGAERPGPPPTTPPRRRGAHRRGRGDSPATPTPGARRATPPFSHRRDRARHERTLPTEGRDRGRGDPRRERRRGTLPLPIPRRPRPPKRARSPPLAGSRHHGPQARTPPPTPRRSPQTPLALSPGGLARPHTRRSHTSTSPPRPPNAAISCRGGAQPPPRH